MKKFMALLLTLAMTASFITVPAMAENEDVKLKITPDVTTVDTTNEAEVTYTIGVEVKDANVKIGSIQFDLVPPEGMTLATTEPDYEVDSTLSYHSKFNPNGIFDTTFEYTPSVKRFVASGATEKRNLHENKTLMTIKAKIAAGTNGNLTLHANNVEFGYVDGINKWTHAVETTDVTANKAAAYPEKPTSITLSAAELIYNGEEQTVTVTNGFDAATMNIAGNKGTDVNTYTVRVTPKEHWKDGGTEAVTATWKINVLKLEKPAVSGSFNYSGTVQSAAETNYNEKFIDRTGEVSATDAGTYAVAYALKNTTNTTWTDDTTDTVEGSWTINKIAKETVQLNTSVKVGGTTEFDFSSAVEKGGVLDAASVTGDTTLVEAKVLEGNRLQLKASAEADDSKEIVVSIPVKGAKNYNDYTIKITVAVTEKLTQNDFDVEDVTATYGDTDVKIEPVGGVGKITYTVENGTDVIGVDENGTIEIKKAGTATVKVIAAGDSDYAEATKVINVTVNKYQVNIPAEDTTEYIYNGSNQTYGIEPNAYYTIENAIQKNADTYTVKVVLKDKENTCWVGGTTTDKEYPFHIGKKELTIKIGSAKIYLNTAAPVPTNFEAIGLVEGDSFVTAPTLYYETVPDTSVKGSVAIKGKDADAGNNYSIRYIDGTLLIAKKSSGSDSSGGGGGVSEYAIKVSSAKDGKITLDKTTAAKGGIVTITPQANDGFVLDKITVTDRNGSEIALTDKGNGTYTFTMPASRVEIKAAFKEAEKAPVTEEKETVVKMQINSKRLVVDGVAYEKDAAPVIRNDRTLVPIRFITESLGGEVTWNEKAKEVVLTIDGKEIKMTIGKTLEKYGVAPIIMEERTFVPIRFVADELGAAIAWDEAAKTITVTK